MIILGYESSVIVFVLAGVLLSFSRAKEGDRKIFGVSNFLERFISHPQRLLAAEAVAFLILGCMISIGVTNPTTIPQALAAGLAWTGVAMGKA